MVGRIKEGWLVGDGAAQNVSLGWYPSRVDVINATDGDLISSAYLSHYHMAYSSGGTTEVTAGMKIKGATSGATARVKEVLLSSGTWAGGDAAGFLILDNVSGTFSSENVYIDSDDTSGTNDATVTANETTSLAIALAVASGGVNATITRYAGSTTAAIGFTIGSTISEEAKLLRWIAVAADH